MEVVPLSVDEETEVGICERFPKEKKLLEVANVAASPGNEATIKPMRPEETTSVVFGIFFKILI
ncbi:MAG: hypothetical protein AAGI45_05185 [Cyanobacteria bacterium P01_H01_bin.26]